MKISAGGYAYAFIPVVFMLFACSSSDNAGIPTNVYFAALADSGTISEISYREHRLVLRGAGQEMGWYIEHGSDVYIGKQDIQTCLSTTWIEQYTGSHVDAVIFEDDGQGSYDLRFITVSNPVYDEESDELSFDALSLMTFDELTYAGDSIELGRSIVVFLNEVHEPAYVALPSGEVAGEDYNVSNDITSGIINTYQQYAEDFDSAVNSMIQDATGLTPGEFEFTLEQLNAMLAKIDAQTALTDSEKNLLLTCTKEEVTLPSCTDLTGSTCRQNWKDAVQSRIDALNHMASTVNTATLTTDALIVQAKQSLRDTVSGAASTIFTTLKKLAQKLDS